jgi:hypothetical protein
MKLTSIFKSKSFVKTILFAILVLNFCAFTLQDDSSGQSTKSLYYEVNGDPKTLKFLFLYKYPQVQNDPTHKLNLFTYKNVLFAKDQVTFFESTNESEPVIL